ncbi:hypothetical protein B1K54_04595 [Streptomyces sp. fd1-xmd]|nr:hypothetical protein B1K54_04595 [Streptomyces sp. fd1-xmd]
MGAVALFGRQSVDVAVAVVDLPEGGVRCVLVLPSRRSRSGQLTSAAGVVVPRGEVTEAELLAYARDKLAHVKAPKRELRDRFGARAVSPVPGGAGRRPGGGGRCAAGDAG